MVVLDNAQAHRGRDTRDYFSTLRVRALFLPSYSPELNAIEIVWGRVKERVKAQLAAIVQTSEIDSTKFTQLVQRALTMTPAEAEQALQNNRHALSELLNAMEADE